jgi:hypothetical protein
MRKYRKMFNVSLRFYDFIANNTSPFVIPFRYRENSVNFIKIRVHPKNATQYIQFECLLKVNEKSKDKGIIEGYPIKFFNNDVIEWMSSLPTEQIQGEALLSLEFPNCEYKKLGVDCEITAFSSSMMNALKIGNEKRINLRKAVELYVKDKYRDSINIIGNIGELIAKSLALKITDNVKHFRDALNKLSNEEKTQRKKINYLFLASQLWSIYYIRNEQAHPNPKIYFDKSINRTLLKNLEQVIKYLASNKIVIERKS